MLKEGYVYSLDELKQYLNVSKDQWKRNKEKYYDYLSQFYDYEIKNNTKDKRKKDFIVVKIKADYIPFEKTTDIEMTKRDKMFDDNIANVIAKDYVQTYSNINRIIRRNSNEIANRYTDGSSYQYVNRRTKYLFGSSVGSCGEIGCMVGKVWCRYSAEDYTYYEIEDELVEELYSLLKDKRKERESIKLEAEINSDFDCGLITKEERDKKLGEDSNINWCLAKKRFYNKHGFYPQKVPVYELSAFTENGDFEYERRKYEE